jgi:hypothetical protein
MTRRQAAVIAAIAALSASLGVPVSTFAQQAAPAPPPGRAAPELLFRMALENTDRKLVTTDVLTTSNLNLHPYGDGKNIIVSIGKAETDPHLFDGLCDKPCGMTLQDRDNYFDLRGRAKIKWTTIVSGFHRAHPLIKLADGTLLIGDKAEGSIADWQQSEVSLSEVRWLKLDPERGVTLGTWVPNPDLSKVDEVGFFDVIPGSGVRVAGVPVEKLPNPPVGGWIAIAALDLWGKPVSRDVKIPRQ